MPACSAGVQASAGCGADTPINSSNAFAAVFSPPAFANPSAMRWAPGRSVNARPPDDRAVREELLQTIAPADILAPRMCAVLSVAAAHRRRQIASARAWKRGRHARRSIFAQNFGRSKRSSGTLTIEVE